MKAMFIFNIDHTIDITTNSSSEMFLFSGQNTDAVHQMIIDTYPEYETEYSKVKSLTELTLDEFAIYWEWVDNNWNWRNKTFKSEKSYGIPIRDIYDNLDQQGVVRYFHPNLANDEDVIKKLMNNITREKGKIFIIFSHGENPNWNMQEALMNICTRRIHMG